MDRRLLISLLACGAAGRLLAQEPPARPRLKLGIAQLHDALSERFPVRFGLAGLLELEVSAPGLHLLPARNKLGAALRVEAAAGAPQPIPPGELDVVFGLRYHAPDRSLRGREPEVLDVRWPGLAPDAARTLRSLVPGMVREVFGEVVLHEFSAQELAVADGMGLQPETITVVQDGLVIGFGAKPLR
jgi:hypothetical protein